MKVFNWMNRRFLHGPSCTSFLQVPDNRLEKDVRSRADVDRDGFLGHGGHVSLDVFKDWKDGLLTIGTLAIGPWETPKYEIIKEVDDDDDHHHHHHGNDEENSFIDIHDAMHGNDDVEASPLMTTALFSHELEKVGGEHNEIEEEVNVAKNCVDELKDNNDNMSKDECQIKRRVTLADLFSEDSDHHLVNKLKETDDGVKKDVIIIAKPNLKMIKPSSRAKNGLSKAKKLLKQELLPAKKLNQLMKRMMKRKIHPDLEGKLQKKEIQMQPSNNGFEIPTNEQDGANELDSLLLIQDSMV